MSMNKKQYFRGKKNCECEENNIELNFREITFDLRTTFTFNILQVVQIKTLTK